METPWTRAKATRSELQEKRLGSKQGGSRQVNSGRFWRFKRDAKNYNFLVEARTTENASYRIEKSEWLDIRKQGFQTPPGLLPAMNLEIQDLRLMVIEEDQFDAIIVELMELQSKVEMIEREMS